MKFSIVIPTQDRPALLAVAAKHAMQLEYPNFEVIVSDNSTNDDLKRQNAGAVRHYRSAPNFKLVSPSRALSPPEHFEFALDFATGDYLAYLTDKMAILPRALSDADAAVRGSKADIVNWAYAPYVIDDSRNPSGSGTLAEEFEFLRGQPKLYDPIATLRFKASGAVPRDRQNTRDYALGKIVFGCFSRELVDRIRAKSGTVFCGATHDYSAMVQALSLARSCVMLNRYEIVFITLPRDQSLGSATATQPQRALEYFRSFSEADSILASLLVPGLYASQHNMVAHDYRKFLPLYGNMHFFNETNWLSAIRSDLTDRSKIWADSAEKNSQFGLFTDHLVRTRQRLPVELKRLQDRLAESYRGLSASVISCVIGRLLRRSVAPTGLSISVRSLDEAIRHVLAS
jgi:glycosyltransferase involved in cell wall biosynthesis